MDIEKTLEPLTQVFSRFFISGLVFYLFAIWLPSYAYLGIDTNDLLSGTFFVMLFSIMLGLLLDLSRSYRPFWRLIFGSRTRLRRAIVSAFNIHIDDRNECNDYETRISDVSRKIHDIYIRTYHCDIDRKILDARIYPNILGTTLLSITLFLISGVLFLVLSLVTKHLPSFAQSFQDQSFTSIRVGGLILMNLVLLYVLFRGRSTARLVFDKTTELTSSMIGRGYIITVQADRDRFIDTMSDDLISFDATRDCWKIRE